MSSTPHAATIRIIDSEGSTQECALEEFERDNAEDAEMVAAVRALKPGQATRFGGGSAPEITVVRVFRVLPERWQPRPNPSCPACRGAGGYYDCDCDDSGPCGCELPLDAEARDHVVGEAVEVLTLGYRTLGFTLPSVMAEREVARQLDDGELDETIEERVALFEDRARMQRLDRDAAERHARERRHVREAALKAAGGVR